MIYKFKEGKSAQNYIEVQYLSDKPLTVQERDCLAVKDYTALIQVVERLYDGVTFEQIMSLFDKIDPFEAKWEEILENFKWDMVVDTMGYLGWYWRGQIVTQEMLIDTSMKLLRDAYENKTKTAIGGLVAEYYDTDDTLELRFELSSWDV